MSIFKPHKIADNEPIQGHNINKKADAKLDIVAQGFTDALGDKVVEVKKSMLRREIVCKDLSFIHSIRLDYSNYENRLWAFLYNLRIKVEYDSSTNPDREVKRCNFKGMTEGKLSTTDAKWVDNGSDCSEEKTEAYIKCLNNKLIRDRMIALDMGKLFVEYNPSTSKWAVEFQSMIGSATWILIPPVIQLVKPTQDEYAKAIEFLQLVMHAVNKKVNCFV